jgi:hypothetical protein
MSTRVTLNTFPRSLFGFAVALGIMLASASVNAAQIYGQVTLPSGATAPGQEIKVEGKPMGTTDASGGYRLSLPPGQYTLTIGDKTFQVLVPPSGVRLDLILK